MKRTTVVIYVGSDKSFTEKINHWLGHPITVVPDFAAAIAAARAVADCDVMVLCEKTRPLYDLKGVSTFRNAFPDAKIILVTADMTPKESKAYVKAGINDAVSPDIDGEDFKKAAEYSYGKNKRKKQGTSGGYIYDMPTGKRIFDIVSSAAALIVLSPLLLLTALAIRIESPGPVIYKSKRVGSNYRIFDFYKFRSMFVSAEDSLKKLNKLNKYSAQTPEPETIGKKILPEQIWTDKPEDDGQVILVADDFTISEPEYISSMSAEKKNAFVKIEDDPRITKVGRFIRKFSIDELPQLINILKGDMSVVGNRPLPLYEAEKLTMDDSIDRFMCPAGLTGLWQAERRGEAGKMSAEERKRLDIEYAENYSMLMDFKIIIKTFAAFIQKDNV